MSDKVDERNRRILDAGVALATERGLQRVTRDDVAERAGVATGSVNNAFGTMGELRDAIMAEAVSREIVAIVAEGLALRHPAACAAPAALKEQAVRSLAA